MSNKFYLKSDKADWVHKQQSLEIKSNFDNIIIKKNIIPFIDFNKKIHFLDVYDFLKNKYIAPFNHFSVSYYHGYPNSLDKNTPAPLLLINDGVMYEGWAVAGQGCCMNYCCCCCAGDLRACKSFTSTVDAMIGANKLKPMVVININAGGKTDPYEQRSLELNTRDDKYGEFLETEVIPLVEKKFNLQISKEAKDRAVIGTSSGAANVSSHVECFNQFIIIKLLYIIW